MANKEILEELWKIDSYEYFPEDDVNSLQAREELEGIFKVAYDTFLEGALSEEEALQIACMRCMFLQIIKKTLDEHQLSFESLSFCAMESIYLNASESYLALIIKIQEDVLTYIKKCPAPRKLYQLK